MNRNHRRKKVAAATQSPAHRMTVRDPMLVWHYCPAPSFEGIIASGYFRLSDPRFTNDPRELKYSEELIVKVVRECIPQQEADILAAFAGSPPLILSFSGNADSLSQWRGYADGGRGYAIGVQVTSMNKWRALTTPQEQIVAGEEDLPIMFAGPRFDPVLYDREEQETLIRAACGRFTSSGSSRESMSVLRGELLLLAPFIKHKSYSEECEWRVASSRLSLDKGRSYKPVKVAEFVVSRTEVRRFEPLYIKKPHDEHQGYGPVVDLIQTGPQNRSHADDVRGYILSRKRDWTHVHAVPSSASYSGM